MSDIRCIIAEPPLHVGQNGGRVRIVVDGEEFALTVEETRTLCVALTEAADFAADESEET